MVNASHVKRKLASLLVDGPTTKKKSWNSLMRFRYQLQQLKKRKPERFNSLTNELVAVLTDIKEECGGD